MRSRSRIQRGLIFAVFAVLAIAFLGACSWSKTDIQNILTNTPGSPSGQPSPGSSPPPPGCAAVDRVSVSIVAGNGSLHVGAAPVRLDATPRSATGDVLDSSCHGSTASWAISGSASCTLSGDLSGFNPEIACTLPGSITVKVTVSSPGGEGSATFPVQ